MENGWEIIDETQYQNVMDMKNYSVSGNWCTGEDHVFIWGGDSTKPIPEGLPCSCGETTSHIEACKECGSLINKPIVINKAEKG